MRQLEQRNNAIIAWHDEGFSRAHIAREFRLSPEYVAQILTASGRTQATPDRGSLVRSFSPQALLRQFNVALAYLWKLPLDRRAPALRELATQASYPSLEAQLLERAERPDGPLEPLR